MGKGPIMGGLGRAQCRSYLSSALLVLLIRLSPLLSKTEPEVKLSTQPERAHPWLLGSGLMRVKKKRKIAEVLRIT
jgi:hypothetical protein